VRRIGGDLDAVGGALVFPPSTYKSTKKFAGKAFEVEKDSIEINSADALAQGDIY